MKYIVSTIFLLAFAIQMLNAQGFNGYYQTPDIHNDQIVFTAEGDLWTVSAQGGLASRLTTHAETELLPHFSPDGQTISFSASYEGPLELYTIPATGGMTMRWTYESSSSIAAGWSPSGDLLYATTVYNKKPDERMVRIDQNTKAKMHIPLDQASEGVYDGTGKTFFFVRPADHNNVTKRYQGGTARQIWKYTEGSDEAVKLTSDHNGESHHPLWYDGRIYYLTDRDGMMNIWSMDTNGGDLKQHTEHDAFDVRYANVHNGKIVYQLAQAYYYNQQYYFGVK